MSAANDTACERAAAAIDALRARVGAAVARRPQGSETAERLSREADRAIGDLSVAFGRVEAAIARIDIAANVRRAS